MALAAGVRMVINNDAHGPGDLVSPEMSHRIALGAGLTEEQVEQCRRNSEELVKKALR
jgi:histidinol phosphatase-like PHP family hydrolase